ncbi:MAG: hypothetical protein FJ403_21295 [Verrucomicrobia bacterium]|nr:hypothetical protein [Verrucomicrobiota bacterium]
MMDQTRSFSSERRRSIGLNVGLSIAAVLALVVMVNYLANRHFRRIQLTESARYPLSPLTTHLLGSITNRLKVIVFFDPRSPLFSSVKRLVNEYEAKSRHIKVEYVDHVVYRNRAEQVREQYKLAADGDGDRVIFEANGKTKVVYAKDLSEYDYSKLFQGEEVKRTGFKGEQLFTSAVYGVIDPRPVKAYFLQGQREHDPASEMDQHGYSQFAQILHENNVLIDRLGSLPFEDVPADCHLLIIAGPVTRLAPVELEKIDKYLSQGGRLLALFNWRTAHDRTGLEKLLADNWGVTVGHNFVTDNAQNTQSEFQVALLTDQFSDHPIVKPLRGSRLALIVPRSISQRSTTQQSADAAKVAELVFTGPRGLAVRSDKRVEREGQIPLAVAVEKGTIPGISTDRGATRIVVVGESGFLANKVIEYEANRDFARNAVNWLLNREILLEGIGPHAIKEYKLILSEAEMKTLRRVLLGGFPGATLLCGFLVWLRRRR